MTARYAVSVHCTATAAPSTTAKTGVVPNRPRLTSGLMPWFRMICVAVVAIKLAARMRMTTSNLPTACSHPALYPSAYPRYPVSHSFNVAPSVALNVRLAKADHRFQVDAEDADSEQYLDNGPVGVGHPAITFVANCHASSWT